MAGALSWWSRRAVVVEPTRCRGGVTMQPKGWSCCGHTFVHAVGQALAMKRAIRESNGESAGARVELQLPSTFVTSVVMV